MKALLQRLHDKLGDFWWYSLMLFCAIPIAVFAYTRPKDNIIICPIGCLKP